MLVKHHLWTMNNNEVTEVTSHLGNGISAVSKTRAVRLIDIIDEAPRWAARMQCEWTVSLPLTSGTHYSCMEEYHEV